jgi:hypothetical protein
MAVRQQRVTGAGGAGLVGSAYRDAIIGKKINR